MGSLREAIKFPLRKLNRFYCALAHEKPTIVDVELRSTGWLMPSQVAQAHRRLLEGLDTGPGSFPLFSSTYICTTGRVHAFSKLDLAVQFSEHNQGY